MTMCNVKGVSSSSPQRSILASFGSLFWCSGLNCAVLVHSQRSHQRRFCFQLQQAAVLSKKAPITNCMLLEQTQNGRQTKLATS